MKGFAKIALSVALIAVIVLSLVVASVAWFTSNPEVGTNDVTLDAARTMIVTFGNLDGASGFSYNGQKGNVASGAEAPYKYEAGTFTVDIKPSSDGLYGKIKVEFGTVEIRRAPSLLAAATGSFSDILITDLFHIDAKIYVLDSQNGTYVKDPSGNYMREAVSQDALLPHYRLISENAIADDGTVMNSAGTDIEYFREGTYYLSFSYTFLPEDAYLRWMAADYSSIFGFERAADGAYIGVVDYVDYKAKYHYGMKRYNKSATTDLNDNYTYTEAEDGEYVRAVKQYKPIESVEKYTENGVVNSNGAYIKIGDSNDYVLYSRYNQIPGFPYSNYKYMGAEYLFTVRCSVEEVVANEAE